MIKRERSSLIAENRKARHEYSVEERFEAGLSLQGWEVKSINQGKVQISEGYVLLKHNEAWLIGSQIIPLLSASTHINANGGRTRKLLLHRKELNSLVGLVERKGYALVPLSLYWKRGKIKLEIGVAKGKKNYDKRADLKERDWQREKARITKLSIR